MKLVIDGLEVEVDDESAVAIEKGDRKIQIAIHPDLNEACRDRYHISLWAQNIHLDLWKKIGIDWADPEDFARILKRHLPWLNGGER